MDVSALVKSELDKIWSHSEFKEFTSRPYLFPSVIEPNCLLFIGINPSYNEQHLNLSSYAISQNGNTLEYFKKMEAIADDSKIRWSHLDLFYFRETNQNHVYALLKTDPGVRFLWQQLELTKRLIEESNSKVIVVSNALAATFFGKYKNKDTKEHSWMDFEMKFSEDFGTYIWNGTPIFFSGMLSGQRALDLSSLERLKWHIRLTISKLNEKS